MKMNQPAAEIPRRSFLRMLARLGSFAAVSIFLKACQKAGIVSEPAGQTEAAPEIETQKSTSISISPASPAETPTPAPAAAASATSPKESTAAAGTQTGKVALVVGNDRQNLVPRVMDLFGFSLPAGMDVFVKPNFNSADPPPGSTHVDTLRALLLKLKALGAGPITVGDRSGMAATRLVMESLGIFGLAKEMGFDAMVLDELPQENWRMITLPGMHWAEGFPMPVPCLESPVLVQTCCLKTHRYGGHFTMSLKNSVGLVAQQVIGRRHNYMNELHGSPDQRRMIAEINTAYTPALVLLDGVDAFVNGGPDRGERVSPNIMLAGTDRVAIDAVGVAVLRKFGSTPEVMQGPIFELEQIARAAELGLGAASVDEIDIITDDPESARYADEIRQVLEI